MINLVFLLITTFIWGFGFIATKWTFVDFDGYWSHSLRFLMAGMFSLPFLLYQKSFFKPQLLLKGYIASWWLFGALFFQTIGLYETTVAKSGFITTMYALFTPIFGMLFFKKKFHPLYWALVLLSFVGIGLLCNLRIDEFNRGDFWTLLCAISGAGHILYVEKVAGEIENAVEFNFLQSLFMGINSVVLVYLIRGGVDLSVLFVAENLFKPGALTGLLYLSLLSSMVAFSLQIVAQKRIPSHIVSLVFLLESPIAAFFGYTLLGESLNTMNLVGCALILLSVALIPIVNRLPKNE